MNGRTPFLMLLCVSATSGAAAQGNTYGPWRQSNSCPGLDYRVRVETWVKRNARGEWFWYVQFRNRYREDIHFTYTLARDRDEARSKRGGRIQVDGRSISSADGHRVAVRPGGRVWVHIFGKFRLGEDRGPYVRCP